MQLNSLKEEWLDRFGALPEPVCELITIVNLRILAYQCGINGLIRPMGNLLELNLKINFAHWKNLQNEIPNWLKDRLAISFQGAETAKILVKITELNTSEQLDLLEQLFKSLKKVKA